MSTRSPIGRPVVGRPRRSRTVGSSENQVVDNTGANGHHSRRGSRYGKHDAISIPKVPRIPDKFLLQKEDCESSPTQESIEDLEDERTTDLMLIPAPHTRYLPNCSFGKPKEVQVISNAMMQTYIAMRGNCLGGQGGIDPLFEWIQQREDLAQVYTPTIDRKRQVSRMLFLIDKALESSNMGGDSPRDCVFEVYRPDFEHIKPPQDMDMSANEFAACCADFEWNGDSDDEEADVPSGRISPCTFLEWSKDCARWNGEENENKRDTTSYIRMRPPTPTGPAPHRARGHEHEHEHIPRDENLEPQFDIHTGEELTPAYCVPTSPSIIYTPPGVAFAGFQTADFHAQYRRMVPLVDRELRAWIYGAGEGFPNLPDSERDRFSSSEVEAATTTIPPLSHRIGPEVRATLHAQWSAIRQTEAAEKALYLHAEQQRQHIEALKSDSRHLSEFLPALRVRRTLRDARARRRGDLVRAYVADHALDVRSRLDMAAFRLGCTRANVARNAARIAGLEDEVQRLCVSGGVRDAGHAFAVLMGGEDEEEVCERGGGCDGDGDSHVDNGAGGDLNLGVDANGYGVGGFGFGYGNGNGNGYPAADGRENTAPLGPWSASSLGRAEEEYDRFLADMHMQDRRGRPGSQKWERRCSDDEPRDSGVSGVGNRSPFQGHDGM
ncbi:hypothetical protein F5B18DRAFT_673124 [Nemania serpens]|nr:hypothetical protein F5B18DRAFT_673124 [Nemania serpens]